PRLNSARAHQRATDLEARMQKRLAELGQERRLAPASPVVVGGALVVPAGLLAQLHGQSADQAAGAHDTARGELLAMAAVMRAESHLGYEPRDVSADKCGYDIESRIPNTGRLRFIEVKGRIADARTVTLTRNEILTALNKPDDFILALVEIEHDIVRGPRYVRHAVHREPDFNAVSVNYNLTELLREASEPS
ncbi:MAG: DUF3883 domain-containing protein, partial [Chloroflexota bacterium]